MWATAHTRRQWHPTPVLLPGGSHGWRSLEGCSPWGRWGLDMTEWLHFHFSLWCLGEEMEAHSSVLAWRIPGTGEPGGLLSMGSHRVRHDWSDLAAVETWAKEPVAHRDIGLAKQGEFENKLHPSPNLFTGTNLKKGFSGGLVVKKKIHLLIPGDLGKLNPKLFNRFCSLCFHSL